MADPLSITTSVFALVGVVLKVSVTAIGMVDNTIGAHEAARDALRNLRRALQNLNKETSNMRVVLHVLMSDPSDVAVKELLALPAGKAAVKELHESLESTNGLLSERAGQEQGENAGFGSLPRDRRSLEFVQAVFRHNFSPSIIQGAVTTLKDLQFEVEACQQTIVLAFQQLWRVYDIVKSRTLQRRSNTSTISTVSTKIPELSVERQATTTSRQDIIEWLKGQDSASKSSARTPNVTTRTKRTTRTRTKAKENTPTSTTQAVPIPRNQGPSRTEKRGNRRSFGPAEANGNHNDTDPFIPGPHALHSFYKSQHHGYGSGDFGSLLPTIAAPPAPIYFGSGFATDIPQPVPITIPSSLPTYTYIPASSPTYIPASSPIYIPASLPESYDPEWPFVASQPYPIGTTFAPTYDNDREGTLPSEQNGKSWMHDIFGSKERRREKEAQKELTGKIRSLTASVSALNDWELMLELCEHASVSEKAAKETAEALRQEFKDASPHTQLSAAQLWAVMLQNSSDFVITQTATKKFMDTVGSVVSSPYTLPLVKDQLLDVLAAAAFTFHGPGKEGFQSTWKRVRPPNKPENGAPFKVQRIPFAPPVHMVMPHEPSTATGRRECLIVTHGKRTNPGN